MACKPKVPARKRPNEECKVCVPISVGTFCLIKPVVSVPVLAGTKVKVVKKAVAEKLDLRLGSHNIFGLYLGDNIISITKILQDEDVLTANMLKNTSRKYFFKRIALDLSKETTVAQRLEMVTYILYCEFKERFTKNLIWPVPTEDQARKLRRLVRRGDTFSREQAGVLKYVREELREFYYLYYHKVDKCTLLSKVTGEEPKAKEGSKVSVSVNFTSVIITYFNDEDGKAFDFTFKWDKVRSLDLDRARYAVVFEVLIEDAPNERCKNILRAVTVHSDNYEYIFSMGKYMLLIHEKIANFERELYQEQKKFECQRAVELKEIMSKLKQEEIEKAKKKAQMKVVKEQISHTEDKDSSASAETEGQKMKKARIVSKWRYPLKVILGERDAEKDESAGPVSLHEEQLRRTLHAGSTPMHVKQYVQSGDRANGHGEGSNSSISTSESFFEELASTMDKLALDDVMDPASAGGSAMAVRKTEADKADKDAEENTTTDESKSGQNYWSDMSPWEKEYYKRYIEEERSAEAVIAGIKKLDELTGEKSEEKSKEENGKEPSLGDSIDEELDEEREVESKKDSSDGDQICGQPEEDDSKEERQASSQN